MIDCHKCKHYYVTWDKNFPHGCKAMRFKSKQLPSIDVRISSQRECLLFNKKAIGKTNKAQFFKRIKIFHCAVILKHFRFDQRILRHPQKSDFQKNVRPSILFFSVYNFYNHHVSYLLVLSANNFHPPLLQPSVQGKQNQG